MTYTSRGTPVGTPFDEGYRTLIAFAQDPDLSFWESVVGAPGIDGGDPIPTFTHWNDARETYAPRALKRNLPFQVVGKFASGTLDQVDAIINQNDWITVRWPDMTGYSFPGFLKSFQPGQAQPGAPLEATLEVVPTMQISGVETDFIVLEQGSGS